MNHGTTLFGVGTLLQQNETSSSPAADECPPCSEDVAGSDFMQELTPAATPRRGMLAARAILLQEQCATDYVDHLAWICDSVALHASAP